MSVQHGGMVVQLHHQPVQVGRDSATCRLVFRDNTPGVSSRHCQIFFDEQAQAFVVTDLGPPTVLSWQAASGSRRNPP